MRQDTFAPGPLESLRILAVEEYGVGPFATQIMADLGADVIKIENGDRGGDSSRHIPPFQEGTDSLYFESLNRGKRSVVLDLKSDEGQRALRSLAATADGILNNLRSTTAERLGLRYANLKDVNPKIVCCSASGWGTEGPRAGDPAYDYLLQAYIGNMALTGEPGQPPARSAVPWVDMSTGIAAALGLVSGILSASRTDVGRDIDVSMVDVGMSQWMYLATWYLSKGREQEKQSLSAHPSVVPSQLFRTADGYVIVMPQTNAFWRALCKGLGVNELTNDPRFASMADRRSHKDELLALLNPLFEVRTSDEWIAELSEVVPIGKVNSLREAMDLYAQEYPEQVVEWEHDVFGTVRTVGNPIRFGAPPPPPRRAPRLGEHTDEVLAELGDAPLPVTDRSAGRTS